MLLAALVLVAHSFEVCNSHLGFQAEPLFCQWVTVTHNGVQYTGQVGEACLCAKFAFVPLSLDSDSHQKGGDKRPLIICKTPPTNTPSKAGSFTALIWSAFL